MPRRCASALISFFKSGSIFTVMRVIIAVFLQLCQSVGTMLQHFPLESTPILAVLFSLQTCRCKNSHTCKSAVLQADEPTDWEAAKLKGWQTHNPENRQTLVGNLLDSARPRLLAYEEGSFRIRRSPTRDPVVSWSRAELPGPLPQRNR